jgi:hypothetical protein
MIVIQKYCTDSLSRRDGAMIGRNEAIAENKWITQEIILKLTLGPLSGSSKVPHDNWSS